MHFTFSESAKTDIGKLPKKESVRLKNKLLYWQSAPRPLEFAKPLIDHAEATHRFRLGAYRLLIKRIGEEMRVLCVRHRKDVYNK